MSTDPKTRSLEATTKLAASPEAVWKAITDPEEITRWFAPEAKVEPGPDGQMAGGTMSISWGPGAEGTMSIEVWEPNRRLVVKDDRSIVVEYLIEAKDGFTTLRLIQSGFGEGADWDGEFEGSKAGWAAFFRTLKYNLEQHPGEPIRQISITLTVDANPQEQWTRLLGGQLDSLDAGSRYTLQWPTGERLEGTIEHSDHKHIVSIVVENWNRALLTLFCERCAGKGMLTTNLAVYGPMVAQSDEIETRWRKALEELFAQPA